MIEKRFTFVCDDDNCFFKDKDKTLYCYEVVELLNDLHEDLKHELKVSKALREVVGELEKENEQLKQQLDDRIKYTHQLEVELRKKGDVE